MYPSAASYTVFVEGSTYFAKSQNGALLDADGDTNASAVFQQVFDSMTSYYGGEIFIKSGKYTLTHTTWIPNGIPIKIRGERGQYGSWLVAGGENGIFYCAGTSSWHGGSMITLEDLHFDGGAAATYRVANKHLVYLNNSQGAEITRCLFSVSYDDGLRMDYGESVEISDCAFVQCNGNGFASTALEDLMITSCESFENQYSGYAFNDQGHTRLVACRSLDNEQYGIYAYNARGLYVSGCDITDNDKSNTGSYDGICLTGTFGYCNYIIGNFFKSNDRYQVYLQANINTTVVMGNSISTVSGVDWTGNFYDLGTDNMLFHNWNGTDWEDG